MVTAVFTGWVRLSEHRTKIFGDKPTAPIFSEAQVPHRFTRSFRHAAESDGSCLVARHRINGAASSISG
jgi:hypothetical protein